MTSTKEFDLNKVDVKLRGKKMLFTFVIIDSIKLKRIAINTTVQTLYELV